jgi:type VI secretion system protein ImpC
MNHDDYCWMNAAYVMGTRMTDAFAKYGWCTAIRGAEGGGKVENLPTAYLHSDDGDPGPQMPDRDRHHRPAREGAVQSRLPAALPLQEHRLRRVLRRADRAEAEEIRPAPTPPANAAISARLPYIMATSRFAHYLKVMARDKIGSFMEASDCEDLAESLDQQLRQRQRRRRAGDESPLSRCAKRGRGEGDSGASPGPTTPWRICGPGCRWKS